MSRLLIVVGWVGLPIAIGLLLRWLILGPRYYVVSVWHDATMVTTFRREKKAEALFHSLSQSPNTELYRVAMIRDEEGRTTDVRCDDRLDKLVVKPKDGGLRGEAKILTFPKRKDGE